MSNRIALRILIPIFLTLPAAGWCVDDTNALLQAVKEQQAVLSRIQGKYQIVKRVNGKDARTTEGTFLVEGKKARYQYTVGGREFIYAFDGRITYSLKSEDLTGRLTGNLRADPKATAPGIGRPDTNPREFMLTVFSEPLDTFQFYSSQKDIKFTAPASGSSLTQTEKFKILVTGREGNLLRAETIAIDPSLLSAKTPVRQRIGSIGYSPSPTALEKIGFAFDTTKNYALAEKQILSPSGLLQEKTVVKEFSMIDGVWIPTRLERVHYQDDGVTIRMTEEVTYSEVKLPAEIDDREFEIVFPPGTQIRDEVIGTALGPDDSIQIELSDVTISGKDEKIDITLSPVKQDPKPSDTDKSASETAGKAGPETAADSPTVRPNLSYLPIAGGILILFVACIVFLQRRAGTTKSTRDP